MMEPVAVPLVWFVFNRLETTEQTLQAILRLDPLPSHIHVFCDGARTEEESVDVGRVRDLIEQTNWPVETSFVFRERNYGCAGNIRDGISAVLRQHERVIILEEDTLPHPQFCGVMAQLLEFHQEERRIFSVGAYPSMEAEALAGYTHDSFISSRFSCWGWATWRDRWQSIQFAFDHVAEVRDRIAGKATWPDLSSLLETWQTRPAFYWDLPILLGCLSRGWRHALTRRYYIRNIGFNSGTHGQHGRSSPAEAYARRQMTVSPPTLTAPVGWDEAEPWFQQFDAAQGAYIRRVQSLGAQVSAIDRLRKTWSRLTCRLYRK